LDNFEREGISAVLFNRMLQIGAVTTLAEMLRPSLLAVVRLTNVNLAVHGVGYFVDAASH
jgi:hypothetical protein